MTAHGTALTILNGEVQILTLVMTYSNSFYVVGLILLCSCDALIFNRSAFPGSSGVFTPEELFPKAPIFMDYHCNCSDHVAVETIRVPRALKEKGNYEQIYTRHSG
jgi:hypothetical protein